MSYIAKDTNKDLREQACVNISVEFPFWQTAAQSSPQILYTSDLHLGHANIIWLCHRPFLDVEEMNRALINNWNARVGDNDHVYLIGDLAYQSAQPVAGYLRQMRGHKHLILGNHDKSWIKQTELSNYFESVEAIQEIEDRGRRVVLRHYPHPLKTLPDKNSYLVHGHIHNSRQGGYWPLLQNSERILNASVEINGYQPVSLDELIKNNGAFKSASYSSCFEPPNISFSTRG